MSYAVTDLLRLPQGPVSLADHDPGSFPGFDLAEKAGKKARKHPGRKRAKKAGKKALKGIGSELAELQEKLFATAYTGGSRRILVVLQGMDTSGKGGVIDHAFGLMTLHALRLTSFKAPTEEERAHDFLWRVRRVAPAPGLVGIFDRSHYEDVLIARVHELAAPDEIESRYEAINAFEKELVEDGTAVIKCMLHTSRDRQRDRLLARLDEPAKQWKFKPEDVDERGHWDEYQKAYEIALERCNTDGAPWYLIPSDHKWYRNWAVGHLVLETLRGMQLEWPAPDYDVEEQRARLEDESEDAEASREVQPTR